ncbi:hypothetical protein [Yersinia aleksiciae]|uniref:Pathogenicity island chaperone protein SpiC n=1 Tax=Yersinia aleksiciae TaxID=263819 RepID=A0ABM5UDW8_YERAE|nr:hypothetical protein [Yersinia aleksiciae]AKP33969.1 hypothetical protein ACZ76_10650 [Yersinia aleksiciae]MDA5498201.1 hypothetical protein [Yersinia aleksiciae]NIL00381.1 hypothetical protein [Yersinia aleksiciae]WQC70451.1 hypothetical protein N0K21_17805 [Yersinia aleksiciae]CFQ55842.1 pathogenicity island chaperone protein SpiC [Yersinia aleksiciae]
MQEMLRMQPLISNIDSSDINIVEFTLMDIPSKAMDYNHSICIGVFFIDRKMISDVTIRYITLMLVLLEETQDFALQLNDGYWWLWFRYTVDDNVTSEDKHQTLSINLEQIHSVIQYLNSLVITVNSSKTKNLTGQERKVSRVIS